MNIPIINSWDPWIRQDPEWAAGETMADNTFFKYDETRREWPTCTHDRGGKHPYADPCGRDAVWTVWFNDGWEKSTTTVCDEHLPDAQDEPDYVGATAI